MSICVVPIKVSRLYDDQFGDKYLALMDHLRLSFQLDCLWQLEQLGSDQVFKSAIDKFAGSDFRMRNTLRELEKRLENCG